MYVPKYHFEVAILNARERTEVRNNFNLKLVDNLIPKVPQDFFQRVWSQSVSQRFILSN